MGVKIGLWYKGKADSLTDIYEPIMQKLWEPRRLTAIWAFTVCYRDSFTFLPLPESEMQWIE
jgi:hypothetical protein